MTSRLAPFIALLCALLSVGLIAGCERGETGGGSFAYGDSSVRESESDDEPETDAVNPFEGAWKLTSNVDGSVWYAFFNAGGTWRIANNLDGSQQRVYGTYSRNGNRLSGDMINPNVGTGSISAVINDGVMTLDFTEEWHTPYQTTRYTGRKI